MQSLHKKMKIRLERDNFAHQCLDMGLDWQIMSA